MGAFAHGLGDLCVENTNIPHHFSFSEISKNYIRFLSGKMAFKFFDNSEKKVKTHAQLSLMANCVKVHCWIANKKMLCSGAFFWFILSWEIWICRYDWLKINRYACLSGWEIPCLDIILLPSNRRYASFYTTPYASFGEVRITSNIL